MRPGFCSASPPPAEGPDRLLDAGSPAWAWCHGAVAPRCRPTEETRFQHVSSTSREPLSTLSAKCVTHSTHRAITTAVRPRVRLGGTDRQTVDHDPAPICAVAEVQPQPRFAKRAPDGNRRAASGRAPSIAPRVSGSACAPGGTRAAGTSTGAGSRRRKSGSSVSSAERTMTPICGSRSGARAWGSSVRSRASPGLRPASESVRHLPRSRYPPRARSAAHRPA